MTAETELMLFSASRAQLVREKIFPALMREEIVLCDRFMDSTMVYQGFARGLDLSFIAKLNQFVVGRKPDLTVFLDVDPKLGLLRARKKTKTADRMEAQSGLFYKTVCQGFYKLARLDPYRIKKVDASQTISETAKTIWKFVEPRLSTII